MNSFLHDTSATKTKIAFNPILPYVATEYDTIHIVMCNVLLQKSQSDGPLWCNEGVYRLEKELQLLDPAYFDNIFLGLGDFRTEKVLIENEVYGPANVKHAMNGGQYVRRIRGMAIILEVIQPTS